MSTVESIPVAAPARRQGWRRPWVWAGVLLLAGGPLVLATVAWSYLALPREAATLRDAVMRATAAEWRTTVQADVGAVTLGAVRILVGGVQAPGIEDARLALAGVRRASAGVYRRAESAVAMAPAELTAAADAAMRRRGWERIVAVAEGKRGDTVLVYAPRGRHEDGAVELCVAVLNRRDLVVATVKLAPEGIAELMTRHWPDDWRERRERLASR